MLEQEQCRSIGVGLSPTRLFHGTNAKYLPRILAEGLVPRGEKEGNWDEYESRPDLVYLTAAYAAYFAMNCTDPAEERVAIIEVDADMLEAGKMLPDEDYISQHLHQILGSPLKDLHEVVRNTLESYQHHWMDSLQDLGNVAYQGTIPASAVTRYCVFSPKEQAALAWAACDPLITPMNYRFCGEKYRQMIAWLFGDRRDWQVGHMGNEEFFKMMDGMQAGYSDYHREQFANRSGIEVVNARGEG